MKPMAMPLRLNSLKTRTALAIASIIAAVLVNNAVYLILSKRAELRRQIEKEARTFARLTRGPIAAGFQEARSGGLHGFRELMRESLALDTDIRRILVVDVGGQVLFDTRELDESRQHPPAARWVREPERLAAIQAIEPVTIRTRDEAGREMLEIVAPHLEQLGRHELSVVYQVSYDALRPEIARLVYATGGLTLISILASTVMAVALATRITRPLQELTAGARGLAEGRFDRTLNIRSNDEIQVLAETFNDMTGRLKENVEKLEESNKKLGALNEELQELDRMKSDLLANVSHELRTPLTAIKGYTDYILERKLGAITEKQEKGLVVVQRNLERLSRSINALLDFSRMDVGRIPLELQPFGMAALVEQIATGLRSELEKKRLQFKAAVEPDLPPVIADREKLSAVLENLVINAIKFTPEGGRITLWARRLPAAPRPAAEIGVTDTGIGIPADQVDRIFVRFHQVETSTTRRFGGVGLGLAIVKSILDAHGAPISVESEVGRGTTFRFTLPVLEKPEAAAREEPLGREGEAVRRASL